MGNEAMNRLDWLGAQATEPGDGGLWHKWHVPDLVRAARALEGYQCYGKERCKEIKLKDGTCIRGLDGTCGDEAFEALKPLMEAADG